MHDIDTVSVVLHHLISHDHYVVCSFGGSRLGLGCRISGKLQYCITRTPPFVAGCRTLHQSPCPFPIPPDTQQLILPPPRHLSSRVSCLVLPCAALIICTISQFLLWVSYCVIYAFWLSPLRHFPGPKLWAISRIPLNVSVLRGYNHLDILALHDRYGPAIRISPDELAFNTPQSFRDIYGNRPGGCFRKDRSHYIKPANGVDHLVCAVDNSTHARQRRLLAHAFSEKALRDQEGLIRGYVDTLINKLRLRVKNGDSLVDIKSWMNFTTFDITGDLMFGESFDCLKDSQLHPWIRLIFDSMKVIAFHGVANQFPLIKGVLDLLVPAEAKRKGQEHFDLTAQKVDRRLETNMARPDFMSAILQNGLSEDMGQYRESKRIMTRAEIHSNGFMWVAFWVSFDRSSLGLCKKSMQNEQYAN